MLEMNEFSGTHDCGFVHIMLSKCTQNASSPSCEAVYFSMAQINSTGTHKVKSKTQLSMTCPSVGNSLGITEEFRGQ